MHDSDVVGLSLDEAGRWAAVNGLRLRVVQVDGRAQIVTMDYRTDRLNVAVQDGKVVSVVNRG